MNFEEEEYHFHCRVTELYEELRKLEKVKWNPGMGKVLLHSAHIALEAQESKNCKILSKIMRKAVIPNILKKDWKKAMDHIDIYIKTFYGEEKDVHDGHKEST